MHKIQSLELRQNAPLICPLATTQTTTQGATTVLLTGI